MKFLITAFTAVIIFSAFLFFGNTKPLLKIKSAFSKPFVKKEEAVKETVVLKTYADKIKLYLKANNYNQNYCFLVNMKLPSGK